MEGATFSIFLMEVPMRNALVLLSLGFVFLPSSCKNGTYSEPQNRPTAAETQWLVNDTSKTIETWAEQGPCHTGLPKTSISTDWCFLENPVAVLKSSLTASGAFAVACVATHESASGQKAALIAVNDLGEYVAEAYGDGEYQTLASVKLGQNVKIYVGFPANTANQKVLVRAGRMDQFKVQRPACVF